MSYYNNNTSSPRQDHSAPYSPTNSRPIYTTSGNSAYVNNAPTYISSPFDDDPIPPANNYTEKNQTPYDNSYYSNSNPSGSNANTNNYSQQPHSPSMTEKGLAGGAAAAAGHQTYGMQHQSNAPYQHNNFSSDSHYYNGYDEDRPSLSNDTAPMRPYADMETSEGLTRSKSGVTRVKYGKKKSRCLPHSTCGRITCCCCLLLVLVAAAIAIVVFTVFKLPSVNYQGMAKEPEFKFNEGDTTLAVSFEAKIEVKNPNPIGFKFESITATAYYPDYAPSLGGGTLTNVDFPSKSTKVINFPISATYSGSQDKGYVVVKNILERCGELGGPAVGLTINYDLKLSFKIIGITISPTIKNQHVNIACPPNYKDILQNLPAGALS